MTTTPATTTLAAFIERMLDEDEAAARTWQAAMNVDEETPHPQGVPSWVVMAQGVVVPARVLAQVAALRAVVELHANGGQARFWSHDLDVEDEYGDACAMCGEQYEYPVEWPCGTLKAIAAIWSSHPAFEEAWGNHG